MFFVMCISMNISFFDGNSEAYVLLQVVLRTVFVNCNVIFFLCSSWLLPTGAPSYFLKFFVLDRVFTNLTKISKFCYRQQKNILLMPFKEMKLK